MFAIACAVVWIAIPIQGPRWELVRAASRYDALLVKPPPGAPPEVRDRATQLTALVEYLQREAVELWYRGLEGGHAELDPVAAANILHASRDIGGVVEALNYPAGMLESYWPQANLLDKLAPVCAELRNIQNSPWAPLLPVRLEVERQKLRITFLPILRLMH